MSELTRGLGDADQPSVPNTEKTPKALTDSVDGNESDFDLESANLESDNSPHQDDKLTRLRGRFRRGRNKRKKRRRLMLAVLPTLLTLGNAVCGLAAIAIAMNNTPEWSAEQKLFAAGMLIFAGMLFDALDGSAARLMGQTSQFGAELDSLCDAITFGTAPAVIVWQISDQLPERLTWAIGVLFALCVLIRLARFNVETDEDDSHDGFEGLPSPAAAGTLAAFAIAVPDLREFSDNEARWAWARDVAEFSLSASHYVIPALALVLAFLMVSRFQYPHVVQQWVGGRRAPHQIGQGLFAVFCVILLHWIALPLMFCYFAFGAPLKSLLNRNRQKDTAQT